jgi:hypothetical protein
MSFASGSPSVAAAMTPRSATGLRASAILLAVLVGLYALWLLTTEFIRPQTPYFPIDTQQAVTIGTHRSEAKIAAWLGLVRGDLWTDYAMALAFSPVSEDADTADDRNKALHAATERAIALGPHDARAWLLLSKADARLDWLNRNFLGPLKMSYYTGPDETALIPMRLAIATQSEAITDPELQILVTNDLRTILLRWPKMKPAIIAAYRDASREGKHFLETAVAQMDSSFAMQLSSPTAAH